MIKKKRKINKNRKGIKKNNNNNNKKEIIEIRNTKRNIIGQSMGKIRIATIIIIINYLASLAFEKSAILVIY